MQFSFKSLISTSKDSTYEFDFERAELEEKLSHIFFKES